MKNSSYRYCGRDFSQEELETIRRIIAEDPNRNRAQISRLVCQTLTWCKPDGGLKDMSCRVALLRMHKDGILCLPQPRHNQNLCRPHIAFTATTDTQPDVYMPVNAMPNLRLQPVVSPTDSQLWREYIHRYHYLGYTPLPGAQLRYMARVDQTVVALLGFGAAAWTIAPRDKFIGWGYEQRRKNLHLVVNNARFLVLPWIHVKNLASKLLAMAAKRLPSDWEMHYGYRPVLMETFVEINRFQGTCYKAANWIHVGQTKGRGKLANTPVLPIKNIWLYPLTPTFQKLLCQP